MVPERAFVEITLRLDFVLGENRERKMRINASGSIRLNDGKVHLSQPQKGLISNPSGPHL